MQLSILVSSDCSTGSYLKDKEKILRAFVRRSVNSSKRVRRSFTIFLDDMTHSVVEERDMFVEEARPEEEVERRSRGTRRSSRADR